MFHVSFCFTLIGLSYHMHVKYWTGMDHCCSILTSIINHMIYDRLAYMVFISAWDCLNRRKMFNLYYVASRDGISKSNTNWNRLQSNHIYDFICHCFRCCSYMYFIYIFKIDHSVFCPSFIFNRINQFLPLSIHFRTVFDSNFFNLMNCSGFIFFWLQNRA